MAIELTDVQFNYPDQPEKTVLNIPSWSLTTGETAFLHGPSGSGKSTLLKLLSGLLAPARGSIEVFGQPLEKLSVGQRDRFRAEHIGFVFQQFNLISYLDPVENVRVAAHFARKKAGRVQEKDIKDLLAELQLPSDEWSKPASSLSIGQQQRVAIARALINKPQLLIADEPTSSLDQDNRDVFMALLMDIVKHHNITLLFVSHDMGLSQYFRRVESLSDINQAGGGH